MTSFWPEIGLGFEEPGGTPAPRIPCSPPSVITNLKKRKAKG